MPNEGIGYLDQPQRQAKNTGPAFPPTDVPAPFASLR